MTHRIVLSRPMNLPAGASDALAGLSPRNGIWHTALALNASLHEPVPADSGAAPLLDRLRSRIAGPAELWALARRVVAESGNDDVIFCPSEAAGLQMAGVLEGRRKRPRLALFVHNLCRPRGRAALKWWSMAKTVDLFLACSTSQVEFLRSELSLSDDRVRFVWDHTDDAFFTPGRVESAGQRPRVVSVGLEQRNYRALAEATHDLDVDVCISGFSKDAAMLLEMFPNPLPANMSRRFYSWIELRDLYRSAAVVVVPCRENRYAAGVQSLMEASACGRPIVATATEGLQSYLHESIASVHPGDMAGLRAAIVESLGNGADSKDRGARNRDVALTRNGFDRFVDELARSMRSLA